MYAVLQEITESEWHRLNWYLEPADYSVKSWKECLSSLSVIVLISISELTASETKSGLAESDNI
ncbi:MAG: hypothetical protein K2K17_01715 [Lachnospiraceae bacterium]|nr:hypothetical protein [Lachnospiraceae bacterium]